MIVADEIKICGRLNSKTGAVSINPFDLDHDDMALVDHNDLDKIENQDEGLSKPKLP